MAGGHIFRRWLLVVLVAVLALPPQTVTAFAQQERSSRPNLLELLFGGGRRNIDRDRSIVDMPQRQQRQQRQRQRSRDRAPPARTAAPRPATPPAPPTPAPVAKLDNARQILVIGDFLAGGLGDELATAFEQSPGVAVAEKSNGSSGIVRDDYYDWPQHLPPLLDEVKPAIVVVMIGANDRQALRIGNHSEKFRTDAWFKEYERRVHELAAIVTARKLPLLWVGLPSFQSPSMMTGAATLNTIYRSQVEKLGGEFVDIWEGFVDEEGRFIITGSDMNGQQARLRGSDGINFTKAGKRKLAFYVEKFARRHLGEMASPEMLRLDDSNLPELQTLAPTRANAVPVQPISLSDPELDGGKELLGASKPPASLVESPRDMLVRRGELPPAPQGRIDNYQYSPAQR